MVRIASNSLQIAQTRSSPPAARTAGSQPVVSLAFPFCFPPCDFFGFKLLEKLFPLPGKRAITGKLKGLKSKSLKQSLPMGMFRTVVAGGLGAFFNLSVRIDARSRVSSPIVPHDEFFLFEGSSNADARRMLLGNPRRIRRFRQPDCKALGGWRVKTRHLVTNSIRFFLPAPERSALPPRRVGRSSVPFSACTGPSGRPSPAC